METKVMVAVPTGEFARRADFYDHYNALERPAGTIHMTVHGQSPAQSRNKMIEKAQEHQCSHILFLDDDMCFGPDVLTRLLAHDKDVVSALYLMRNWPHQPVAFGEGPWPSGECRFITLDPHVTGLVKVVNCGFGAVLINMRVFEKLTPPYVTLGGIKSDEWCDDIVFFNRVTKAGFEIYCDLDALVGHMASITIWPKYIDGKWNTLYHTNNEGMAAIPQVTTEIYEKEARERGEEIPTLVGGVK
jgi:hypothetical protein